MTGARLAEGWPPPLLTRRLQETFLGYVRDDPGAIGWRAWYLALAEERIVIGSGGFKGRPDADGMVEVGYSVMHAYQRRGYCTEAIGALIAWAFSHAEVSTVRAETDAVNIASQRVMQKNGLRLVGDGSGPGEVRYAITREEFERPSP